MNKSKTIALSALTTAICAVILIIGAYFPTLSLSAIFMASLMIMLPLAKNSYKGALLAVVASALLSFLLASFSFETSLPFLLFFGFHPIINRWQAEKRLNKVLAFFIKDVWCVLVLIVCYYLTDMFITENEFIEKYMFYIIIFGGSLFFLAYDLMFFWFQRCIDKIILRLKI